MINLWVSKQYLDRFLLRNESFSSLDLHIFVLFAIHIVTRSLTRGSDVLFCELVVVKDLSFLSFILVNKSNFDAPRFIRPWLIILLTFHFGLLRCQSLFF